MKNLYLLFILLFTVNQAFAIRTYIPLDSVIKIAPIIIEGKVIGRTAAYYGTGKKPYRKGEVYTSHIVEVLKIFKGKVKKEILEIPIWGGKIDDKEYSIACGSVSLLGQGQIGIFFLYTPADTLSAEFENSPTFQAKHQLIFAFDDAVSLSGSYNESDLIRNVERNLYQRIERICKTKRKIIKEAMTDDEILKQFRKPKREKLLRFEISQDEMTKPGCLDFAIRVYSSNKTFIPIQSLSLDIKYNTAVFGTNAVKNKRLAMFRDSFYYGYGFANENIKNLYDTAAYQFKLIDISPSVFRFSIVAKDTSKGIYQISDALLARFHLNVLKPDSMVRLELVKANVKFFDYDNKKISKLKTWAKDTVYVPFYYYLPSIIDSFSPDTINCDSNEYVTVKGKYLMDSKPRILIWCQNSCGFYGVLPLENFIFYSSTMLKFKTPCNLDIGRGSCGSIMPAHSGFFVGRDKCNQSIENTDHKVMIRQWKE